MKKKGISQDLTFMSVSSCESLFYESMFLSEWTYKMQEDSTFSFAEKNTLLSRCHHHLFNQSLNSVPLYALVQICFSAMA